ncbi:MAG: hypothetical protein ABIP53_00955, partial [Candidatus Limnocylindrales bacterium]
GTMSPMDRDNPQDIFPHDGAAHSFDVVIRGYDRSQVHDVVDRLDGELRVALADKDASAARATDLSATLAKAQAELEALRQTAKSAAAPNFESMGARISHMLQLAEEEANDIRRIAAEEKDRSQAELKATKEHGDQIRTKAQAEVKRMTEEAQAESRRVTEEAEAAAAKTVEGAQKQSDELSEHARAAAEQAEVDSKARVAKMEEDFQVAQKARRAEAARVEQERDQSSRRDAQGRIEKAQRKSDDMVAAAEKRVTDLDGQRAELHTRLTEVREILGALPELAIPTAIESDSSPSAPKPVASNGRAPSTKGADTNVGDDDDAEADSKGEDPESKTDVQGTPPPPPSSPSWPVNHPTQAIQIPRKG